MKRHLFCSVAVVTLVAGASPTAFAADAKDAPAGAAAQPASDTGVGEIVVRAQRVEQSLQKVPVAVTPVTGAALETRRLARLLRRLEVDAEGRVAMPQAPKPPRNGCNRRKG